MKNSKSTKYILGIWDGHDSGAAIIRDDKILFAINEERLTRRKLEVCFPKASIKACLDYLDFNPEDISEIAVSTCDVAKTITRVFPNFKERYYLLRRRKTAFPRFFRLMKYVKYSLTEIGPNFLCRFLSGHIIKSELKKHGFKKFNLYLLDHHLCHVACAAFCAGYTESLVVTLDGVGDGLSGTINTFKNGNFTQISKIKANRSFGIFFEHVTNLLNMRELEDEGKVMALANYAYPIPDQANPLMDFFQIEGLKVKSKYSSTKMYRELKKILWHYPSEQFAYMAQRTLELKIKELIIHAIKETKIQKIALSGGVASNIKLNMLLRELVEVKDIFIFPHMGDGGLALGAALLQNFISNHVFAYRLKDLSLGMEYDQRAIFELLEREKLIPEYIDDIAMKAAQLIAEGNIVLWFQGRMELGPRALGNRSILARPDSIEIKDKLNLAVKKRVWYQPFCPTILLDEAKELFEDFNGTPDRFMTSAYIVKPEKRKYMEGVINIDGSCRPQIINNSDFLYSKLLLYIKDLTGYGVILNTSFNLHEEPLVCSPHDAINTFKRMNCKYLILDHYLIKKDSDEEK
ncbi:MAG: carbamoyltransferase C-terminal domain-containing protein [Candidatus Hodarchaeota archaeon]